MTPFLILVAVLLAGALLLVVPPLLGGGGAARKRARQRQAETALAVLREQLAELEAEQRAGRISEAEYTRSREELERRAIEEGEAADDGNDARPAKPWAFALAVAVPLLAGMIYLSLGEPDALDPAKVAGDDGHRITPEQMVGLVAQLAERLEREPGNAEGWMMLARSYAMLQDYEGAAATWRKLGDKVPQDPDILADWADVLAGAQDRRVTGEPERLVTHALELEPNHVKALALAGTAAFQREDYAAASRYWERILAQIPPGEEIARSVLASINEARAKGGMPLLGEPSAAPDGASTGLAVKGRVSLAPEVAERAAPDDTVFVFVRPAEGGMPVAALRYRAGDLPADFDFQNVPTMSQGALPAQLTVAARVSKQGDAKARPGDLEGASAPVAPDAKAVEVVIDKVRE